MAARVGPRLVCSSAQKQNLFFSAKEQSLHSLWKELALFTDSAGRYRAGVHRHVGFFPLSFSMHLASQLSCISVSHRHLTLHLIWWGATMQTQRREEALRHCEMLRLQLGSYGSSEQPGGTESHGPNLFSWTCPAQHQSMLCGTALSSAQMLHLCLTASNFPSILGVYKTSCKTPC